MIDAPSSTWFSAAPHWGWLIVAHFMLSAIAAGLYFLATMIDVAGRAADRPLARLGYFMTLPLLAVVGVVLIVDLSRPDRFWHMLLQNHTLLPALQPWVPMSNGSFALAFLSVFALLSFVAAYAEQRGRDWRFARRLREPGIVRWLVAVPGAVLALFLTGYTGVMISVLNRPIWSDTSLFGLLFVVSAVAMAAALLVLVAGALRWRVPALGALRRILVWLLALQAIVLVVLLVSLGPAARGWLNVWGVVLAVGVAIGVLLPLAVLARRALRDRRGLPLAAALVLAGGFCVRTAIVFVPQANAP